MRELKEPGVKTLLFIILGGTLLASAGNQLLERGLTRVE